VNPKQLRFAWLPLLLCITLLAAACSDDKKAGTTNTTGNVPQIEGDVVISGSSTVAPISSQVGEMLQDGGSGIAADVDNPGTGDGFKLFCAGDTDISDASRPIKAEEAAECKKNGVEFVELKIAFDGISVLANPKVATVECLSFADLYALAGPESKAAKWSDATALAAELGSTTKLPDAKLEITAPGEESGTYDSFIEIAFKKIAEARVTAGKITADEATTTRADYSSQADDSAIITGIEGNDGGFGWVGFAVAQDAGSGVTELAVSADPGGDCVKPSHETIADGSYPLSRSLYLYVNKAKAAENKAVAGYVDYYLADGYAAVEDIGYVALPDDQLAATTARWEARTTGSAAG
jgi:phosphate transport system substrate-binding protein